MLESYFNEADLISFDLLMNALIIQYDISVTTSEKLADILQTILDV